MVARQGRKGAFLARYLASFLVSGLLFVAILMVFLAATNELFVFSRDNIETDEDLLWGAAFGQSHDAYKLARVRYTKPDLMILGSSRMTQFRDVMAPGARFYNAGQVSDAFSTTFRFLANLYKGHKPKVVILGIDPWWFDPARQDDCVADRSVCFREIDFDYRGLIAAAVGKGFKPRIVVSALRGEVRFEEDFLGHRRPVGLRAGTTGQGFRPDGSDQFAAVILNKSFYRQWLGYGYHDGFAYHRRMIETQEGRFSYTGPLPIEVIELSRDILRFNKENGVATIVILPPFPRLIYGVINGSPEQRKYVAEFERKIAEICEDEGVPFFNFHDVRILGISDEHFYDGLHGDEVVFLEIMRRIAARSRALQSLIDRQGLEQIAEKMRSEADRYNFFTLVR